jgi:hypothetical protein
MLVIHQPLKTRFIPPEVKSGKRELSARERKWSLTKAITAKRGWTVRKRNHPFAPTSLRPIEKQREAGRTRVLVESHRIVATRVEIVGVEFNARGAND